VTTGALVALSLYALGTLPILVWLVHGWISEVRGRSVLARELSDETQRRAAAEAEASGASDAAERLRAVVTLDVQQLDDLRAQILACAGDDPRRARAALVAAGLLQAPAGRRDTEDRGRGGDVPIGAAGPAAATAPGRVLERLP